MLKLFYYNLLTIILSALVNLTHKLIDPQRNLCNFGTSLILMALNCWLNLFVWFSQKWIYGVSLLYLYPNEASYYMIWTQREDNSENGKWKL